MNIKNTKNPLGVASISKSDHENNVTFKPKHVILILTSETDIIPSPLGPNPSLIFTDKSASLSYHFSSKPTKLNKLKNKNHNYKPKRQEAVHEQKEV